MFTGIIEEIGVVREIRGSSGGARKFKIGCKTVMEDLAIGDSLAVNGVCLTIVDRSKDDVEVEAVEETIRKTTLGKFQVGQRVNLERAASLSSRIGGHIVQGHVDSIGKVASIEKLPMSHMFTFRMPNGLMKYLITVGSVAIDGVSLTVAQKLRGSFKVAIIPHTFDNTTFNSLRVGSSVNIEVDLVAKYVESLFPSERNAGKIKAGDMRE